MDKEYIEISKDELESPPRNYTRSAKKRFKKKDMEEHPPIRKRVFNPELKELAGVIISHENTLKDAAPSGKISTPDKESEKISKAVPLNQPEDIPQNGMGDKNFARDHFEEEIFEDLNSDDIVFERAETQQKESPVSEKNGIEGVLENQEKRKYPPDIRSVEDETELPEIFDVLEIDEEIDRISESDVLESDVIIPQINPIESGHAPVIKKTEQKHNLIDLNDYFKFHETPYPTRLMNSILENIKSEDSKDIDFSEIMCILQKESATSTFVILGQDQMYNVYRILTSRGLDKFTKKNLFFSNRDIYLNQSEPFEVMKFKGTIREDFNFKKRFSTDFLTKFSGAIFVNLHFFNFPGWIVFFYRNHDTMEGDQIYSKLEKILPDIIPLLERYRNEQFPKNPFSEFSMYDQVAFALNRMSCTATESVNILYLQIVDTAHSPSQKEIQKLWTDHLLSLLTEKDKLIVQGPSRWIVLTKSIPTDKIMNHVKGLSDTRGAKVLSRNIIYPDNGNNVLNYIFTGPVLEDR